MSSPRIEQLAPSVFEVTTALGDKRLALWLLAGSGEAVVVDTGVAGTVGEALLPALAEVGAAPRDVREILITHADVDHYGGLAAARAAFPHAAVRAGGADRPLIERWAAIVAERYGWYRPHGLDYPPSVWDALPGLKGPDAPLDGTLDPGDVIACGSATFEVLALPGHTAGHIGLWAPRVRIAILADALLANGVPDLSGRVIAPAAYVSVPAYRATIEAVGQLGARELRTSHWPVGDGRDAAAFVCRSRAFAQRLEDAVLDALGSGPHSLRELWSALCPQLGPYASLDVELARSIHSHLEDLEARGIVERHPGAPPRWSPSG